MKNNKINILRELFKYNGLDGYIVPKNDCYFSEYAFPDRLKEISNFSGSAGFAIILLNKSYLFVDGRYTLQAKLQSGKQFSIFEIPNLYPHNIFYKFTKKLKIGFDPSLFTNLTLKKYFKNTCNLIPLNTNLIDAMNLNRKIVKNDPFYKLNFTVTGEKVISKISKIVKILKRKNIDNIFISAPENVAWLLNIRGKDNPNSPIPNSRVIITKNKKIYFFSNSKKIKKIRKDKEYKKVIFKEEKDFFSTISSLKGKNFLIDMLSCSVFFETLINSKFNLVYDIDPCYFLKSIKNKIEIENTKTAHKLDGAALTKFLFWAKVKNKKKITELDAEKKLEMFRKKSRNYLYPSFNTIAGSGPNGAIIHYRANKKSNRVIKKNDIFLCDSGGQYKYGTTDVTRTICFTKPNNKIKNIYTRVLKGHIAVLNTNLNIINKGHQIDRRARYFLNQINLDYSHGTGHGVGFFLNVHEGPQSISKYNSIPIKEGMILSNEPGYYKENRFGIRIENLVYVDKVGKKLKFKNFTFAPIDTDLINFSLLSSKEKKYLSNYHLETFSNISKYLKNDEKKWLIGLI